MTVSKQGKIITFYSYKGGTGRSMALANIAWILAANSKRVLVVDWDLEAPGLQRYFRPFLVDRELTSSPGVVDLITDFILEAITPLAKGETLEPDWFLPRTDIDPYVISLNWKFPSGGQLDLIPAGKQGPDYGQRFAAINWQKFYDVLGGGAFIEQLKLNMRSQYDYILIDSRTGVSDTSGICTLQMPDSLVVCFTLNNQSIEGAAAIAQGVFEQRRVQDSQSSLLYSQDAKGPSGPVDGRNYVSPYQFKIFPVPMRVDQAEQDKLGIRRSYCRRKFEPFLERMTVVERKAYWGPVSVPYVPYFSYEEILATFKDDPSDPSSCLAAFIRIAKEITENEVTGFIPLISPEQRESILQEFANVPLPELTRGASASDNGRGGVVKDGVTTVSGTGTTESVETQLESSLRRAEVTYRSLNDEGKEQARLLWLRLVRIPRPGENVENSKVRVPLKDIDAAGNPVIQKFQTAGVVTVTKDHKTAEMIVEVKDEELLRSWPTLDKWISEERDLLHFRQDLQSSMFQWEDTGKRWENLLGGRRLWKARQWFKTHRRYLSNSEAAYIEDSIKWYQAFASAGVVIIGGLAIALYFFLAASNKKRMVANIASSAEAQLVASTSGSQFQPDQFQLGLLLATEAQRLAPTAKGEALLQNNLGRLPRRVTSFDIGKNVLDLALSTDGSQLLAVTGTTPMASSGFIEDRAAQVHGLPVGQIVNRAPFKQRSSIFQLSPDGRHAAVVSTPGNTQANTQGNAPRNTYLVEVVEAATGKVVANFGHRDQVYDMAFSPDGALFATASGDTLAAVVNLRASVPTPFVFQSSAVVNAVTFSGDSQHLALAGEDSMVHVLRNIPSAARYSDSRNIRIGNTAFQIALSNNGRYLATVTLDNKNVSLWDVETQTFIKTFVSDRGMIFPIWFTPDSRFLMAATAGTVYAWALSPDVKDTSFQFDTNNSVTISDDGKYFASSGTEAARIWEYNNSSFNEVAALLQKSILVRPSFGGSNNVVMGGANNIITVWTLGLPLTDNLQFEACSRLTRNLTLEEWNTYLASYLGAYRRTCAEIP